jgi:hypothetical protein
MTKKWYLNGSRSTFQGLVEILKMCALVVKVREEVSYLNEVIESSSDIDLLVNHRSSAFEDAIVCTSHQHGWSLPSDEAAVTVCSWEDLQSCPWDCRNHATSPEERVSALLGIPVEKSHQTSSRTPLHPVINRDIIPTNATFKDIVDRQSSTMPGKHWCKSLLISDNKMGVHVLKSRKVASKFDTDGKWIGFYMEGREGRGVEDFITCITKN